MENISGTMIQLSVSNYSIWRPIVEDCKDLHKPIEDDNAKPSSMSDSDRKKMIKKAIGCIKQWVDLNLFHHISQKIDVHNVQEKLEGLYKRKTAQTKAFIIKACESIAREGQISC